MERWSRLKGMEMTGLVKLLVFVILLSYRTCEGNKHYKDGAKVNYEVIGSINLLT